MHVLSFLVKLLFVLILGRLIGGLIRLAWGRRTPTTSRKQAPQPKKAQQALGEDIVDAEFEDVPEGKSP